jgi:hypothetical protein
MVNPSVCPANTDQELSPRKVELADVVRRFGGEYRSQYGGMMLPSQKRALADIEACCTKQLGGRRYRCDDCTESFWVYHSCRNRACPKCHAKQTQQWLAKRQAELLPCDYYHAVATVPAELRGVFRRHQKLMYGLLMRVSAEAVQELCAVKRHLGALPGILSVLHSWNGQLQYHPHAHMLITGGGVSSDGQHWEPARGKFLVPVKLLSRKIAAKFRDALRKENPEVFATISDTAWRREWVSFCKHYGRGNDAVLNYLSRYVFRTAISNARILAMDDTHVTFRWKDRSSETWQTERIPGVQFLRRFLQHVLPRGFHRCRYYGLWHASKRDLSSRAWLLLILQKPMDGRVPFTMADLLDVLRQPADSEDLLNSQDDDRTPCCPHCGSARTTLLEELPRLGIT